MLYVIIFNIVLKCCWVFASSCVYMSVSINVICDVYTKYDLLIWRSKRWSLQQISEAIFINTIFTPILYNQGLTLLVHSSIKTKKTAIIHVLCVCVDDSMNNRIISSNIVIRVPGVGFFTILKASCPRCICLFVLIDVQGRKQ